MIPRKSSGGSFSSWHEPIGTGMSIAKAALEGGNQSYSQALNPRQENKQRQASPRRGDDCLEDYESGHSSEVTGASHASRLRLRQVRRICNLFLSLMIHFSHAGRQYELAGISWNSGQDRAFSSVFPEVLASFCSSQEKNAQPGKVIPAPGRGGLAGKLLQGCDFAKKFTNHVDVVRSVFKITVSCNKKGPSLRGPPMSQEPTPREMGYYMALAQTGVEMVLPAVGGYFLDHWLGTTPWITLIAAVFGFVAGFTHMIVILKKKEQDESRDKNPPP